MQDEDEIKKPVEEAVNMGNPTEDDSGESSLEAARDDSGESDVLEFEFNDDGEEDLKKTLKKFRADLKVAKAEKAEYLLGWQK